MHENMVCAWAAGTGTVFLTNPFWLVKTRMQLQISVKDVVFVGGSGVPASPDTGRPMYSSMTDAFKQIVRGEGWAGLYKGIIPALCLTSHGVVQFGAYEEMKLLGERDGRKLNALWYGAMGVVSKMLASTVTYPYQVIKARQQQRAVSEHVYMGTFASFSGVWRREGFRGFWKGLMPNLWRVCPQSAVTFAVYEEVKRGLNTVGVL